MREGIRPPFTEDSGERAVRVDVNRFVKSFQADNVVVIDTEPLFSNEVGVIRFADKDGGPLYQDGDHLSTIGANLVKGELIKAMIKYKPALLGESGNR
jgi:hypothetical protein